MLDHDQSDEDRLATALHRLVIEDPTLAVHHEEATGQTVLSGDGETMCVSPRPASSAPAWNSTPPMSASPLARRSPARSRWRASKRSSAVTGGAIPKNMIPAVGVGIREAMVRSGPDGFPIVDVRAVCTGGKYHAVDSSEMSFKMAGSLALREAVTEVGVDVLDPVSEIHVQVPAAYLGDVLGDVKARRAQVLGTENDVLGQVTTVQALVPTAEVRRAAGATHADTR